MNKSRVITPGELAPKQTVTILDCTSKDEPYRESDFAMFGSSSSHPLTGTPMEVLAVDLPFIAVQLNGGQKAVIDTRGHQLMEVSGAYVKALAAQPEPSDFDRLVLSHNSLVQVVTGHARILGESKCPAPPAPRRASWFPLKMTVLSLIGVGLLIFAYSTQ
jgi:hypothetical protein